MRRKLTVWTTVLLAPATLTSCSLATAPSGFCANHKCIPNFSNGQGSIVQCNDGMWSHSAATTNQTPVAGV